MSICTCHFHHRGHAYTVSHSVVKGTVLTHESMLDPKEKYGASMIWLPAYLLYFQRMNVPGSHWRAPLYPWGETGSGGLRGCSYLLHHLIPGEFVVVGGGCEKQEVWEYELFNAFKSGVQWWGHHREWVSWLLSYFALMVGLFFVLSFSHGRHDVCSVCSSLTGLQNSGLCQKALMVLWDSVVLSRWPA